MTGLVFLDSMERASDAVRHFDEDAPSSTDIRGRIARAFGTQPASGSSSRADPHIEESDEMGRDAWISSDFACRRR